MWKKKILGCLLAMLVVMPQTEMPAAADDMPQEPEKVIYLTFDDGPSPCTTQLLQVLDRYGAKATFFLVDTGFCREELLQQMLCSGHSIGIHSKSHDFKRIYCSEDAYMEDLYAMQSLIREKTGHVTNLMRFPGGSSNTVSRRYGKGVMSRLVERVEEEGFAYFDWNVDSGDGDGRLETERIYRNVIAGIRGKSCAVVLQHDVYPCSVRAVERILLWGRENGYSFRALNAQSPSCHHSVQN